MVVLKGQSVGKGIAEGMLYFYGGQTPEEAVFRPGDPAVEWERLKEAQEKAAASLTDLARKCRVEPGDLGGEEAAALFEAQAILVKDEIFVEYVEHCLREKQCNAEYAVFEAGEQFAAMFAAMDDDYMKARAADIRDVSMRIRKSFCGPEAEDAQPLPADPVILAVDDLEPSELARLGKKKLLGLVMRQGAVNSHTAILARTMELPVVCGVGEDLKAEFHGKSVCLDGTAGLVYVDPDEETEIRIRCILERQQRQTEALEALKGLEDVTLDGRRLEIHCNINLPEDVEAVLEQDGKGIGLFRTEFLYLKAQNYPEEEEQFAVYKKVARMMEGKRVVIRTMDLGADKLPESEGMRFRQTPDGAEWKKEPNPALGMRGIRYSLAYPEQLKQQLRALYRASVYGEIEILFPMITSVEEVKACKQICRDVLAELAQEGIPHRKDVRLGIMIETPAAVLEAEALAKEVDFFSVGTNDLTQYLLAWDRQSYEAGTFYDPHHPAVLKALRMTAKAAREAGIPVGICGELGADEELLPAFLEMGVRWISVTPQAVLPLRRKLRGM